MAGQGLKVYQKMDSQVDSTDKYGRLNFVTYKFAYVAKVVNSMATHVVVTKPIFNSGAGALVTSGTSTPPAEAAPKQ